MQGDSAVSALGASGVVPVRILGILNVTPDSFSDGGEYLEPEAALERARVLIAQGADIVDVGGESTRPGAERITPEEEQRRVLPVIEALVAEGIAVSIDTVRASTARMAVEAGACLINDVSGATADPDMLGVAARSGAGLILMHWRGIPDPGHSRSEYADVVEEVKAELASLAEAAIAAGVAPENLVLDPGLGFDKTAAQGWELLGGLDRLASLGYPILVGISRKRMLGETLGNLGRSETMLDRDIATATVSAFAARSGVWGVRVHDVASTAAALAVARAWPVGGLPAVPAPPPAPAVLPAPAVPAQSGTRGRFETQETTFSAGSQGARGATDSIKLTGLEVFAHHGVFEFERQQGQRFVIDAEVAVDVRGAADRDDLARTVNYAELADAILVDAAAHPVDLIETLAERLARVALGFPGVAVARITVHKPDAPIEARFSDVSVTVVRGREERKEREVRP